MKKIIFLCVIGILFGISTRAIAQTSPVIEDKPVYGVEQMPQFPGGDEELMKFIKDNLHYPKVAAEVGIEGRVTIRFVVSRIGEVTDVTVIRGFDPSCDREAVRVVKMMPKWIPGRQQGRNVPVYYTLPIVYKLQKGSSYSKDPLLLVDGIQRPYSHLMDTVQLKPIDIKEITVLKDSAATTLYGTKGKNGVIMVTTKSGAAKKDSLLNTPDKDGVFFLAETMPQYPGGESALISFISSNLRFPPAAAEAGLNGTSVVRFVVSKTGTVKNATVIRKLSAECDAESMRVIMLMPAWTPGTTKGQPVDVYYTLPVSFKVKK